MKNNRERKADRGSIILEFLGFGLLLQILALALFVEISNLQTYQLAAESIARHGMRAFVISQTKPSETAIQILEDFGINAKHQTNLECQPDCFSKRSELVLRVTVDRASAESVWIR